MTFSQPIVPGEGTPSASLWAIGRDPGADEVRAGRPFVGAAGRLFDNALRSAGLERGALYIDNLVPVRPPGNEFERHNPADVQAGSLRLLSLIAQHKPKLVVAMGNEALTVLLGAALDILGISAHPKDRDGKPEGIQALRGYMFDVLGTRVLACVHPAAILREWVPWRPLFDVDWRRAAAEIAAGCPARPERAVRFVTQPWHTAELRAEIAKAPLVAADIENTRELTLSCMGFATSPTRAWVIPASQKWQLALIRELCEAPFPKVFQNGQYDRYFLRRYAGIETRGHTFDTMLAWHCLQPELAGRASDRKKRKGRYHRTTAKSLRFLASVYTRDTWWKDYAFVTEEERYTLCGKDCCITLEIAQRMQEELR